MSSLKQITKEDIINEFERFVIIRTELFNIDLNFISVDDLKEVEQDAFDMEVELIPFDLSRVCKDSTLEFILRTWIDQVMREYDSLRKQLI